MLTRKPFEYKLQKQLMVPSHHDQPKPKGEHFLSKMSTTGDDDTESIFSSSFGYGSIQSSKHSHVSSTASLMQIKSSDTESVVKDIVTEDPLFPGKSEHKHFHLLYVCT